MRSLLNTLLLCSISILSLAQGGPGIAPYTGALLINPVSHAASEPFSGPPSPAATVSSLNNPVTAAQWHYAGKQDLLVGTSSTPSQDWVYSLVSTDKKETIACGYGLANDGDTYASGIIFKLDHYGNLSWKSLVQYINTANFMTNTTGTLTPADHTGTLFWSITKAADGYIAVGYANSGILVAEVNENGTFINNTPILINLPYTVDQTDLPAIIYGFPTTSTSGGTTVNNYINARGYCVAIDPNANSVNNIIVGGRMQCGFVDVDYPSGHNWDDLGFMVTLKYDPTVSGSLYGWSLVKTYYGGNQNEIEYSDCSYAIVSGGAAGNTINKIITKSTGGASYEIYACGAKAGPDDNIPVCDAGPSGTDLTVTTYDKDIWVLKMDNNYSTASYSEQTYNKNNIYVSTGPSSLAPINSYGSATYPYQDVGPFTARNVNGYNQIISDGTPACNASRWFNASNNKVELGYDMIFSHDGELALVALVNFTGELYDNISNVDECSYLLTVQNSHAAPAYREYKDGDAFLIKLHTDLSFDKAKNVGHFSGNDFIMHIGQEPLEWNYIITGSSSDQYTGDPVNLPGPELDTFGTGDPTGVDAYVVVTDNSFTYTSRDIFRRTFVANDPRAAGDVTPHATDGNLEDCFCGFAMDITADGGYVIGGNNNNNNDDFSVTKFAPLHENQLIGTGGYATFGYSDVPSTYVAGSFGGGTTETWPNANVPSGSNIATRVLVPVGVTLTINAGFFNFAASDQLYDYFSAPDNYAPGGALFGCGIVVEPGGHLVVNDATLQGINTLSGEHNVWDGIVVQGTYAHPSPGPDQGVASLNGATIRDARYGVYIAEDYRSYYKAGSTADPTCFNYSSRYDGTYIMGGGIVYGSFGSTGNPTSFLNCYYGANFENYYYPSVNPSYFEYCHFDCDATGMGDICFYTDANGGIIPTNTHIATWQWDGLYLFNNTFTCSTSFPVNTRANGLALTSSGITVGSYPLSTGNLFTNLSNAISISNGCGNIYAGIFSNTFDNNGAGVNASGIANSLIIKNNQFNVPAATPAWLFPLGIDLAGCHGYDVSYNTFDRTAAGGGAYGAMGIAVNEGTPANETIDNNTFNHVRIANIPDQTNGGTSTGLQYRCNKFELSLADIYLVSVITYPGLPPTTGSLRPSQGSCTSDTRTSAGNQFYLYCPTILNTLFADGGSAASITYNNNFAGTEYDPQTCISSQYANIPCLTGPVSGKPSESVACQPGYDYTDPAHRTAITDLTTLDGVMSTTTDPDVYSDLQAQHDHIVSYLSRYYAMNNDPTDAAALLAGYNMYRDALPFYIQAGDYTDAATMYSALPLATADDNLFAWQANLAINLFQAGKTWFDLDPTSAATMAGTLQMNSAAGYMAGGIAALLGLAPVTWPYPGISDETNSALDAIEASQIAAGARSSNGKTTVTSNGTPVFSVYPNPTNGSFSVATNQSGTFEVYTIVGQLVNSYAVAAGNTAITLPASLATGIYMGEFKPENGGLQRTVRLVYQP